MLRFRLALRSLAPACGAVLLAVSLPVRGVAANPVAVVASAKGRVEVAPSRGGAALRASFGHPLERGDRIKVGAGGSATVFFDDGNVVELAGGSNLRIGGRAGKPGTAAGLPGEVYASVSKFVAGGSRETGLVPLSPLRSGPMDEGAPFLMAPRRTSMLTDRPTFSWRAVPGAVRYRVIVSSAEGGELWRREVEGLTLPYPADAKALARATEYLWEVEAFSDPRSLRRESSAFDVMGEREAEVVRANLVRIGETAGGAGSPAARYLAGSYLSGQGLLLDAVGHFTDLCRLAPASPAPHAALGAVYEKVGLTDLAAAEFRQAFTLSREP
jgi:hypothetical protein